ncbi:hypothetical protein [Ruegeria atlantica]|uniref:hypothetical protein n=1 Tax=Ruegeria atlantica TaxID=81569 RepID=UPI00147FE3FE|nr:hypothetical protein [Ruegeria atlantica]
MNGKKTFSSLSEAEPVMPELTPTPRPALIVTTPSAANLLTNFSQPKDSPIGLIEAKTDLSTAGET